MLSCGSYVLLSDDAIRHSRVWARADLFKQSPSMGQAMHLAKSPNAPWNNDIFLLLTRASNKHPMLHDVLHLCLTDLVDKLTKAHITQIRFPVYDPERSINLLPAWYSTLREHFIESSVAIVLHDMCNCISHSLL